MSKTELIAPLRQRNLKYDILLGSASPRRRALLEGLDIPFTAISIDADESFPNELQGGDIPYYISRAKARACSDAPCPKRQNASGLHGCHFCPKGERDGDNSGQDRCHFC